VFSISKLAVIDAATSTMFLPSYILFESTIWNWTCLDIYGC